MLSGLKTIQHNIKPKDSLSPWTKKNGVVWFSILIGPHAESVDISLWDYWETAEPSGGRDSWNEVKSRVAGC